MKLHEAIEGLLREVGTIRALSRNTGVDASYILRMRDGSKSNPSRRFLLD